MNSKSTSSMRLEKIRSCITDTRCLTVRHTASIYYYSIVTIVTYIYLLFYYRMANTKLNVSEFTTNSVVVADDAIVISFTSDWVNKTKTLPFTEAWLKVKEGIKHIIEDMDYNITNIWSDIKEGWNIYGLVVNLADKQKAINNAFAELKAQAGLSEPIDAL